MVLARCVLLYISLIYSVSYISSTIIPCGRVVDCLSSQIKSSTSWILYLNQFLPFSIFTFCPRVIDC